MKNSSWLRIGGNNGPRDRGQQEEDRASDEEHLETFIQDISLCVLLQFNC